MGISPDIVKGQAEKERQQYEKLDKQQEYLEVYENDARFWVNLKDYLDTGLFLDHRITRQKVQQLVVKHVPFICLYWQCVGICRFG